MLPKSSSGAAATALDAGEQDTIYSKDILSMVSPEGEKVSFEELLLLWSLFFLILFHILFSVVAESESLRRYIITLLITDFANGYSL